MSADLIIHNARIFTGGEPVDGAIAIEAGRILSLGEFDEIRRSASQHTESIDAGGGLLTPGFIDAHVHPISGGLKLLNCSLQDAATLSEATDMIAAYASRHPDREWIWGGGWALEWFEHGLPSAAALDRVVPDRPAFLYNRDGHAAWLNSKALELTGITASTAEPFDGRIERLPDGSPQGTLHEGAMGIAEAILPKPDPFELERALLAGQDYLMARGITGWQDADVRPPQDAAYLSVAQRGELIASVVGALWWDRYRGLEQVEELMGRRALMGPRYRPTSVKLMLDGVAENFTAAMLESYLDGTGRSTGNAGIDFIGPARLGEIVSVLDRLGFQCHFHAIGDRAVRNALDAVELARNANGDTGLMHHIAHIQFVHDDDIDRFRRLRVAANVQALWACHEPQMDVLTLPYLASAQAERLYPFGRLLRSGAQLVMGSDWYVSTPDPMLQAEVAVTRKSPGAPDTPALLPDDSLSLAEALGAFTLGSATINRMDDRVGSIKPGNDADVVIFDRDPFRDGPIGEAEVVATFIRGNVVYERRG
jgi:predicted amidohydrolase YtcJ